MKKILLTSLFVNLTILICVGQNNNDNIYGTWNLVENKQAITLQFDRNGKLDFEQNGEKFKADFKFTSDSTILLGNTSYKILTFTENKLTLQYGTFLPDTFQYVKSIKEMVPISEFEQFVEYYPTGQKKIEGEKHNGFMHGKWTEWYENGQLKSIQEFYDSSPISKHTFWFENGQLKEEKEYNFKHKIINYKRWDEKGILQEEIKK